MIPRYLTSSDSSKVEPSRVGLWFLPSFSSKKYDGCLAGVDIMPVGLTLDTIS